MCQMSKEQFARISFAEDKKVFENGKLDCCTAEDRKIFELSWEQLPVEEKEVYLEEASFYLTQVPDIGFPEYVLKAL